MKEHKVEKAKELKLQIEELEERIAPAVLTILTPSGVGTFTERWVPVDDGALNASGFIPTDAPVFIE